MRDIAPTQTSRRRRALIQGLAGTTLAGQQLLLVAQPQADGRLEWQCRSEQISDKYLPGRCREQP